MKKDKVLHLIVGAIISIICILIFDSIPFSLLITAVAGVLKETWDSKGNGTVELADFIATVAGGVVGVAVCNIISL